MGGRPTPRFAAGAGRGHHRVVTRRRLLALIGIALVAGAVAWALAGLPGPPVACLAAGCDCEAAGRGPIRQPANAWSSLALAAAGIATLITSPAGLSGSPHPPPSPAAAGEGAARLPQAGAEGAESNRTRTGRPRATITWARRRALTRTVAGTALVAAGVAAFLYHAGLTAWAARLDGVTAAVLVGALVLHGWAAFGRKEGSRGSATWARAARALAPWVLVALGGLCWWLGQNERPWCRPDSLLQAHAAWHVLAAGAIGLWLTTEKPARTGPQVLPPSSLRAGDSDTR